MNWTAAVDIYCERLGPGLLAEPINAVTNLSFFVAAWLALRHARANGSLDWPAKILIGLTFAVGLGSTLFHTFAQRWAGAADVIPIMLFILAYLYFAIWRYFGTYRAEAAVLAVSFLFFAGGLRAAAASVAPPILDGATGYAPALLALVLAGLLLALRRRPVAWWLIGAGALFAVSLGFRTVDPHYCADFPAGTHFMWHILNGAVLGTLLFAWLRHGARRAAPPARAPEADAAAPEPA